MGRTVSRIHSKKDNKIYNITPTGAEPHVVFGRCIRSGSLPGMQYYFSDGRVKYVVGLKNGWHDSGFEYTIPFELEEGNAHAGKPCIFTIPDDFEFSRMDDVNYVKQHCRTAINANLNTMSSDFIIRNGKILCIKQLDYVEGKRLIPDSEKQSITFEKQLHTKLWFTTVRRNGSTRVRRGTSSYYRIRSGTTCDKCFENKFTVSALAKRNKNKYYISKYSYPGHKYRKINAYSDIYGHSEWRKFKWGYRFGNCSNKYMEQ